MRLVLALALLASPAAGWEFSADPLCTLSDDRGATQVVVTYDPAIPEYAIHLTLAEGTWPAAPDFAIAFLGGPSPLRIGTDRHGRSPDGRTLTVRDSGFGNVLLGLRTSATARALSGERVVDLPLDGITGPLAAFEACPAPALS